MIDTDKFVITFRCNFEKMNFKEGVGNPVKIMIQPTPEDPRPRDTGRSTLEARALLTYKVMTRGNDKVYFSDAIGHSRNTTLAAEPSDAANREALVRLLPREIRRMELPYFIPQEPGLEMLPLGCKPHPYPADFIKPAPDNLKSSPASSGPGAK